jgi:hypothetical protein
VKKTCLPVRLQGAPKGIKSRKPDQETGLVHVFFYRQNRKTKRRGSVPLGIGERGGVSPPVTANDRLKSGYQGANAAWARFFTPLATGRVERYNQCQASLPSHSQQEIAPLATCRSRIDRLGLRQWWNT